ncbi:hypothetical protein ACIPUC_32135 [Streptomyces sp. LARHCF249]
MSPAGGRRKSAQGRRLAQDAAARLRQYHSAVAERHQRIRDGDTAQWRPRVAA